MFPVDKFDFIRALKIIRAQYYEELISFTERRVRTRQIVIGYREYLDMDLRFNSGYWEE